MQLAMRTWFCALDLQSDMEGLDITVEHGVPRNAVKTIALENRHRAVACALYHEQLKLTTEYPSLFLLTVACTLLTNGIQLGH